MRFSGLVIGLVGVVVSFGVMIPAGEALAFGQQWRPAPGFLPAQGQAYGVGANMPGFRPRVVARPAYGQRYEQMQQQSYPQRMQQRPFPPNPAYAQGYRMPAFRASSDASGYVHQPQPRFAPAGYGFQGWAPPGAVQSWMPQHRAPLFARQYGWRPAGQPWVAQRARPELPQQPRYQAQVRMPAQIAGFRPAGAGYPVPAGSWRPAARPAPTVHPGYAYQPYGWQAPGYAANRQPMFRSPGPPVWQMPGARMAGLDPAPAARLNWRPAPAGATMWPPGASFRPAEYGRRLADGTASPAWQGSGFTEDNLPGWATTHQETEDAGSCGWCSGS